MTQAGKGSVLPVLNDFSINDLLSLAHVGYRERHHLRSQQYYCVDLAHFTFVMHFLILQFVPFSSEISVFNSVCAF